MGEQDDVATLCANIASAVVGHGDLDEAIADIHRLPPDLPARATLAAALVEVVNWSDLTRLRELDGLLEIADGAAITAPRWGRTRTIAEVTRLMWAVAERERSDFDAVTARLDALLRESGADPALKPLFDGAYMGVRFARAVQEGDPGAMARFPAEMKQLLAGAPQDDPQVQTLRELLTAQSRVVDANNRGEDITAALDDMQRAADRLPAGGLRTVCEDFASTLSMLTAASADGGQLTEEQLKGMQARAERTGPGEPEQALQHAAAAAAALGMGQETHPGRVGTGIGHLREALRLAGPGDPQRVFHLYGLALALFRRHELTNSTADLREARTLLEEARALAVGPQHPQWQMLNEMLADVRRLLGDEPDFHRSALEGLRSHVWRVLVQSDRAGVAAAVRDVATDVVDTARRSLVAGDPAGAISALDAGRGLALFAATEVRTIGERLAAAGEDELARRWRAAAAARDPKQLRGALRREVLAALTAESAELNLLDPPGLDEIRGALAAIDADALVYLVPAAAPIPGYAVIAPADGRPSYMLLPNLTIEGDPDIEGYLTTLAHRDAAAVRDLVPAMEKAGKDLAGSLDTLCAWAWGAAMGPLIESYLPRLPQPASGRPYRVVLVPMGDLARVPWQAARSKEGRYAVELIAISQAASARMLCHSAALSPVPPSPVGLLVGDPDTTKPGALSGEACDLEAARLEAFAIRQAFYRGARYLGRRPDGSTSPSGEGTGEQVRSWLTATGPEAGALLHLACHGVVQNNTDEPIAYLLLAGGEKLTAEELIELMARAPERAIGLVVLAACRTGLSFSGYDEAYSLGTAFLAGGARSVLSTQWSVDDHPTSALMFMFHHYLRTKGLPAWAALREAQLWMLNPQRKAPDEMPLQLREKLHFPDLGGVAAWAGFVHWGQ